MPFSKLSDETKFRVRVVFLVIAVFVTVIITAIYASLAPWIGSKQTPVTYVQVVDSAYPFEVNTEDVQVVVSYKEGKLIYEGVVQKPSPCFGVKAETIVNKSLPEKVVLNVNTFNKEPDKVCITVISPETFKGEVEVSTVAKLDVYFNDKLIKAN
jgi:hypothetical protein